MTNLDNGESIKESSKKVLIFIVSYNAERFIQKVLERIPQEIWYNSEFLSEILIIDDSSKDKTIEQAKIFVNSNPDKKIKLLHNPINQGYGGNQKLGYFYAIKNKFDLVVLLHGDGQYAPELLPNMIFPILHQEYEVVLGSRMIKTKDALKGGMPIYKWIGNQILTKTQNLILGSRLAEFHTGYRAYSTKALSIIPFDYNSDDFDFDTDILIQVLDNNLKILEIPIPTYYGDEISYVNGFKYAYKIVRSTIKSRICKMNILYEPKFDYLNNNSHYSLKLDQFSSHIFALNNVESTDIVLDIGCGPGLMTKELNKRSIPVVSIDLHINKQTKDLSKTYFEYDISKGLPIDEIKKTTFSKIFALDIIEHLSNPEMFLDDLREISSDGYKTLILTTPNIGFIIMRLTLLMGVFRYGAKGILDKDHKRLFTFRSLEKLLTSRGFIIVKKIGVPAPYSLAIGQNLFSKFLHYINMILIKLSKSLFSYQIGVICKVKPTLSNLIDAAQERTE